MDKSYPKIVLLTGATSGIGAATAKVFAKNGYRLILTGRRMERLEELKQKLEFKYGTKILILGFTEDIKIKASFIQGLQSLEFPGFTLEYSVKNPMMTMTIAAKEVTDKVDDKQFILDTKGCKKMTMEEFQKTMGAMGGGF